MRQVWAALAGLVLACALVLSVLRNLVVTERVLAVASSLASYAVPAYAFALVVLVVLLVRSTRSRWTVPGRLAALTAVAGLIVNAIWLAPLFTSSGAGTRTDLVVMNSNLEFGEGDPHAVVEAVRSRSVDVLVLEEATPQAVDGLAGAGLAGILTHVAGSPDNDAAGTMVYSRFPLTDVTRLAISNGGVAVTVGAPRAFRLLAVHPSQPIIAAPDWVSDLQNLRGFARSAVRRGPTMVVGDLNSTWDNKLFRNLTTVGLRDSVETAGSGWQPTWPSMEQVPVPRLVTLDHVLTSDAFAAVSTATVLVPRSDHRALVTNLETR